MKEFENEILEKAGHDDGMTVPEGYFDDFTAKMSSMLPEREWEKLDYQERIMPRSFWQKVRPYVYMAAMFMGVWCMMKMFNLMKSPEDVMVPGNNPVLAEALNDDSFMSDYYVYDVDETDILEQLYDEGVETTAFYN
ncbi:MAG: hypothetical protein J1E38_08630 [Paramuribaculum sp.]|nr:hypothetical protein [Paramuribaculum sp.]